jgi:lipopolysaccharide biosynthesis protein
MGTKKDQPHNSVASIIDNTNVEMSLDLIVNGTTVQEDEIERLRQRVEDLELTVVEYRNQMTLVVTSASWKLTRPIRSGAARIRENKFKAKRVARQLKNRGNRGDVHKVLTAGLFMPDLTTLPETSPLREKIDVNTLRRPPEADGPLTRPEGDPRILVVAHVHYPELWADIGDRLARMPQTFDLIITVTEGSAARAIPKIMHRHPTARIEVVPNKGRDWAPLIRLANKGLLSGYDAIAKVHTKKSEHRIDGDAWRLSLLDGVLESPSQISKIIDLLHEDRSVGLVVPTGHIAGTEHWGGDQPIVEALAYRLPMAFDPDELRFPAGSMFWCRPWILERLSDLAISDDHFDHEAGQYDATTAHALERLIGVYCEVAGMNIVENMDVSKRLKEYRRNPIKRPNIYAFYLPQYHQIPENDEFWGEGFTDWDNVKKAKPLFDGHRQPILPSEEVGFYDLKKPEVLRQKAKIAKDHGINGFIFHYYWFDGKKVMDTPLNNWLRDPTIDLPLALSWANESWTRTWDGLEKNVLIQQTYGDDWANRFWDDISPILKDPRYIRVNGAPMLTIYRMGQIPNQAESIQTWRRRAQQDGHPALHLLAVMASRDFEGIDQTVVNQLDGLVAFPPGSQVQLESLLDHIPPQSNGLTGDVLSYDAAFPATTIPTNQAIPTIPTVMPGWDNTARRGQDAYAFHGANAVTWSRHLRTAITQSEGNTLFINAWNEWAEGAALEASVRLGRSKVLTLGDVHRSISRSLKTVTQHQHTGDVT